MSQARRIVKGGLMMYKHKKKAMIYQFRGHAAIVIQRTWIGLLKRLWISTPKVIPRPGYHRHLSRALMRLCYETTSETGYCQRHNVIMSLRSFKPELFRSFKWRHSRHGHVIAPWISARGFKRNANEFCNFVQRILFSSGLLIRFCASAWLVVC